MFQDQSALIAVFSDFLKNLQNMYEAKSDQGKTVLYLLIGAVVNTFTAPTYRIANASYPRSSCMNG